MGYKVPFYIISVFPLSKYVLQKFAYPILTQRKWGSKFNQVIQVEPGNVSMATCQLCGQAVITIWSPYPSKTGQFPSLDFGNNSKKAAANGTWKLEPYKWVAWDISTGTCKHPKASRSTLRSSEEISESSTHKYSQLESHLTKEAFHSLLKVKGHASAPL